MEENKIVLATADGELKLFDGDHFVPLPEKNVSQYVSAASLGTATLLTHALRVPENINPEKLEIQSEMSMYEEAGLNPDSDYKIASVTMPLERENELFVESYAIERTALEQLFQKVVSKLGQIDYIFPSFLRYSALYAYEKLEAKTDVFIYFGADEAYAATYKNGRYIANRSIINLNEFAQKLGIEREALKTLLKTKGVLNENYTSDELIVMQMIQEEFSKLLERIAHAISHKRGIFGLERIDRFFIDFEGSGIPGFLENFANYGYENASFEVLNVFEDIDATLRSEALFGLYVLGALSKRYEAPNLSVFKRKPAFYKMHSGIFFMVLVAALVAALVYPLYAMMSLSQLEAEKALLQKKSDAMKTLSDKLQAKLISVRKEREALSTQKKAYEMRIESYDHLVDTLKQQRLFKKQRQQMLRDINEAMAQYKLSSRSLDQNGTTAVKVHIISEFSKRDDIAKFMKVLLRRGYESVNTHEIRLEENLYESVVEVRP